MALAACPACFAPELKLGRTRGSGFHIPASKKVRTAALEVGTASLPGMLFSVFFLGTRRGFKQEVQKREVITVRFWPRARLEPVRQLTSRLVCCSAGEGKFLSLSAISSTEPSPQVTGLCPTHWAQSKLSKSVWICKRHR